MKILCAGSLTFSACWKQSAIAGRTIRELILTKIPALHSGTIASASSISLAGGHQPMVNPDNGDVLTFNGEIYNYRELRRRLEAEGYRFRSESDTEVLLYAFAAWGTECVRHIRGMYAFALWRPTERALFLFRDPMGIKPLYYWKPPGGGIVFASELKAFLEFPGFQSSIDRRAIGQFLEFGYTFEDDRTILNGVHKLPPGHFLRIRAKREA